MEKLIPVVNRLQDVFNSVGQGAGVIQLPQIVVIGTQSSGKSSVLENLVGRDFLPRGTGIVTRCPLVLQLLHVTEEQAGGAWGWAELLHKEEKTYENLKEVRTEIQRETNRVAGINKGISNDPIRLKIHSPHVLDLTLVDLPGMTKVPVGDQPADIEQQTYTLCKQYIKNPNSIILAVTAANTDIATSEAIKLAKLVDPRGDRTLAVCTKLDLMDRGTDAHDMLEGKVIPVKLGIVGVVNRSQEDIDQDKPIDVALRDEAVFLKKRYPLLAGRNGTPFLAKRLNKLLMTHIKQCLPDLRARISSMVNSHETVLTHLGQPVTNKGSTLLQVITAFSTEYQSTIEGTSRDIRTDRLWVLSGGARICYVFHTTFMDTLAGIGPLSGLERSDVIHAITNATGPRPALFVPEMAFELLVKKQIRLLLSPSLQCVEKVYEEMQKIMQFCVQQVKEFQRFPLLREEIIKVVSQLLKERLPVANAMVEDLIAIELAYINTNHPDFIGGKHAAYEAILAAKQQLIRDAASREANKTKDKPGPVQPPPPEDVEGGKDKVQSVPSQSSASNRWFWGWSGRRQNADGKGTPVDKQETMGEGSDGEHEDASLIQEAQEIDCQLIESLIASYFVIVRKTIQDCVPKAVMHCLVNFVKDTLQRELVRQLYKSEVVDQVMIESPEVSTTRKETAEMLEALHQAADVLNEIRDLGTEDFF